MILFVMGNLKKDLNKQENISLTSKEGLVQTTTIQYKQIYTNT
jgi:hypothetical protein